ncbi:MAG: helix-turn-helix domain containing protein [Chloroflexi bacterium]|nr:helix-turn-helix domain containing protein [Chloroflexota bacterium]
MADLAYREVYLMNQIEARKHLIQTFQETGSLSETARRWHTSRQVVRKWLRRFQQGGEKGLQNKSRRPHHSPRQTPSQVEQLVLKARQATHYGRERLALYLQRCGISISPWLRTHGITTQVTFQTDWGDEFGGDNPSQIAALETRFLRPLQGALRRYPKGRKQCTMAE